MSQKRYKPPIKGMKTKPMLFDVDGGIGFVSCLQWAISEEKCRECFKAETGHNLAKIVNRAPIEMMIDQATGFEGVVIAAFADWVAQNIWGVDQ